MFKRKSASFANTPYTVPAPVGGLNFSVPIMAMRELYSLICENWFVDPSGLQLRDGFTDWATGFANYVDRLHVYAGTTGADLLFATTDSGVYDVSVSGAIGAPVIALTDGKTVSVSISTGAGNYLLMVNGVDTLKKFDGTTWSSVAVLGAAPTEQYSYIEVYRQRVFLVKRQSLEIEYLASNAIAGAPTNYPLGAIFALGGYIVAIGTWTIDGGQGPEDNLTILTNKGQIAVYSGADPATWNLKGVYFVGEPLGMTPMYKYGGDLLLIVESGLLPLSSAVQSTSIDRQQRITQYIKPAIVSAGQQFSANEGWQVYSDPSKPCLFINIPSTPLRKQAVMHSLSGAWSFYSGWNARYFARANKVLYFATDDSVCAVGGTSDNGENITTTLLQAYSRFNWVRNKMVQLARYLILASGSFLYKIGVSNKFDQTVDVSAVQYSLSGGSAIWDTSLWDAAVWAGGINTIEDWQTLSDTYSLWKAIYLQTTSNTTTLTYNGIDLLYTTGTNF